MSHNILSAVTRPARNPADARVYLDYVQRYVIGVADLTANVYRIPILAGEQVLEVRARVAVAFDAGTLLDIGDVTDPDGYMDATNSDIDLAVLNTLRSSVGLGKEDGVSGVTVPNLYARGRYYVADNQIVITVVGVVTVGQLIVEVRKSGYGTLPADQVDTSV